MGGDIPLDFVLLRRRHGEGPRGMLVAASDKCATLVVGNRKELAREGVAQTSRGFASAARRSCRGQCCSCHPFGGPFVPLPLLVRALVLAADECSRLDGS